MNHIDTMRLALDTLRTRLKRIESVCMTTAPKQTIGEMITAMREMPEWEALQAALAEPSEGKETCQMCGDKPYPGCNSEFQGEKACLFYRSVLKEGGSE
jgi:hypothetical protein